MLVEYALIKQHPLASTCFRAALSVPMIRYPTFPAAVLVDVDEFIEVFDTGRGHLDQGFEAGVIVVPGSAQA